MAAKGTRATLSEQKIIDCDSANHGCEGGFFAIDYVVGNGGLPSSSSYPYTATDGGCTSSSNVAGSNPNTYEKQISGDTSLASALTGRAVMVAVDATDWQFYSSGIFEVSGCGNTASALNHAVIAAGMTADAYIIRNSWGTGWGEAGYIRLPRGVNACGVAVAPAYI
jgi:C1A family cysteine protease